MPKRSDFAESLRSVVKMCKRLYTAKEYASLMADLGHPEITEGIVRRMYRKPEEFIRPEMIMLIKTMNFRLTLYNSIAGSASASPPRKLPRKSAAIMIRKSQLKALRRDLSVLEHIVDVGDVRATAVVLKYTDETGLKKEVWLKDDEDLCFHVAEKGKAVLMRNIESLKKTMESIEATGKS
jgi:hypothetical protein